MPDAYGNNPYDLDPETKRRQAEQNRRIDRIIDDIHRQEDRKRMERLIPNHMLK